MSHVFLPTGICLSISQGETTAHWQIDNTFWQTSRLIHQRTKAGILFSVAVEEAHISCSLGWCSCSCIAARCPFSSTADVSSSCLHAWPRCERTILDGLHPQRCFPWVFHGLSQNRGVSIGVEEKHCKGNTQRPVSLGWNLATQSGELSNPVWMLGCLGAWINLHFNHNFQETTAIQ